MTDNTAAETQAANSPPIVQPDVLTEIRKLTEIMNSRFVEMSVEMSTKFDIVNFSVGKMGVQLTDLQVHVDKQGKQMSGQLSDLEARADRQGKLLTAMESYPQPPYIARPAELYGTSTHSVSLARRVTAGYSG